MKVFLFGCILTTASVAGALTVVAARHIPTVRQNVYVGPVAVGGHTAEEAARDIRLWWESVKTTKLTVHAASPSTSLPDETPGQLGVTVDDQASIAKLPMDDFSDGVKNLVDTASPAKQTFPLVFKENGADLHPLADLIQKALPKARPAKVSFDHGQILLQHEIPTQELDIAAVPSATMQVLPDGTSVELPMKTAEKHIPDDVLNQITGIVSQFSTRFPAYNHPRCSNIKLASSKLKGVILMPGDQLSFNGTVGRRTLRAGFKLAGVYKNGKHDVGIGGGICQVSTTLYNACLLADLKIKQRSNHSLPVPYVPLGRDATVDYGDLDLIVQNSSPAPIAVDSHYETGRLTFRILGKPEPDLSVKIVQAKMKSWNPQLQSVVDRTLKPGTKRIIEKGSWGHAVSTYRLVYKSGALVKRELLGRSTYGQQKRVIAYNPAAPAMSAPVGVQPNVGQPVSVRPGG